MLGRRMTVAEWLSIRAVWIIRECYSSVAFSLLSAALPLVFWTALASRTQNLFFFSIGCRRNMTRGATSRESTYEW